MAVNFQGFWQSDTIHPTCGSSSFGTGYPRYKFGKVYAGGTGPGASSNTSLVIPASITNTLCLWFIGAFPMYTDPDLTPATGVGNYNAKLNVIFNTAFGGVTWESLTIMYGLNSTCSPTVVVYQQDGLGIDVTTSGVKTHSFKTDFDQVWAEFHVWYYCFGFGNTNGTDKTITVKYNKIMRYPRPGENRLGLGTGIIHRGNIEDVPVTAKAHAMVGQP